MRSSPLLTLPSAQILPSITKPFGGIWNDNNLIWGQFTVVGQPDQHFSPLDGRLIQQAQVLSPSDIEALFRSPLPLSHWAPADIYTFADRLRHQLKILALPLEETIQHETAFSVADCSEIFEGTLQYLKGFSDYHSKVSAHLPADLHYAAETLEAAPGHTMRRKIVLTPCPWGTVAVMMPQNAVLLLGVTCLLNALVTGNRIVLRSPLHGARTAALLAAAISQAEPPQGSVSVVVAKGREFLEAAYACESPVLVHYLGASSFGGDILKNAFDNRKQALIDGTGNTWVWVSETASPTQVTEILTAGATRYNGQTCTSINGAVVHPAIFEEVCQRLQESWSGLQVGNTLEGAQIGGLFDQKQADFCHERIVQSGGKTLCGGNNQGNLMEPTLVQNPSPESELVTEGIFGPILWLRAGTKEEFVNLWSSNAYPLCAGVLDPDAEQEWWLTRLHNLARLLFNGDPSIEHIYEPWGGYPASGANGVSFWHQKYQRVISLDTP